MGTNKYYTGLKFGLIDQTIAVMFFTQEVHFEESCRCEIQIKANREQLRVLTF